MSHIDRMDAVGEILHLDTTNLATIIAAAYTQGVADAACHKVIGEKRHFLNFEQELVDVIIGFAANNPTKPY